MTRYSSTAKETVVLPAPERPVNQTVQPRNCPCPRTFARLARETVPCSYRTLVALISFWRRERVLDWDKGSCRSRRKSVTFIWLTCEYWFGVTCTWIVWQQACCLKIGKVFGRLDVQTIPCTMFCTIFSLVSVLKNYQIHISTYIITLPWILGCTTRHLDVLKFKISVTTNNGQRSAGGTGYTD